MTYQAIIAKIATHLSEQYGVPPNLSGEAAARLVQDCGLATILVKGLGPEPSDTPRQVFQR